jgi:hypothetical protein
MSHHVIYIYVGVRRGAQSSNLQESYPVQYFRTTVSFLVATYISTPDAGNTRTDYNKQIIWYALSIYKNLEFPNVRPKVCSKWMSESYTALTYLMEVAKGKSPGLTLQFPASWKYVCSRR